MRIVARGCAFSMLLFLLCGTFNFMRAGQNEARTAPQPELYRITWIRAAPAKLQDVITQLKAGGGQGATADGSPLILRHSQGDQWDLMLIAAAGSYSKYFGAARSQESQQKTPATSTSPAGNRIDSLLAWREDEFMWGPPQNDLRSAFASATLFHAEIFLSLAGKQDDLVAERQAENRYQRELSRPEGFIFRRDLGAAWDVMTIAPYQSWKHFAQRDDITAEKAQAAARAAGFKSPDDIGLYLRSLIALHHDTLCSAVR